MTVTLEQSYRHCGQIARAASSSFYLSFWLLSRERRRGMFALYAFSRHTDDISDGDAPLAERRQLLSAWREDLRAALDDRPRGEILPALADTVGRYSIPSQYLFDVIDGVEMDFSLDRYDTFEDLRAYCYRVASAVGLACLHIWGFEPEESTEKQSPADACGVAFQLTNILRDVKEDAARGRVYLPLEDFERFGYPIEDLIAGTASENFLPFMQFQIQRAREHFNAAGALTAMINPEGRRIFSMMTSTYRELLEKIARDPAAVLRGRVKVSRPRKLLIAARHMLW